MGWGTPQYKLAICVKSCHRDLEAGLHDAIRSTWGADAKALGIDLRFFLGTDPTQQSTRRTWRYSSGEHVVDCDDSYDALPYKTRRICQWIQGKMISHVFLCDVDTFVRPKLLLETGFESYDYAGQFLVGEPGGAPFRYQDERGVYEEMRGWASGGFGYFLSRKAAELVGEETPHVWAEDAYVGQSLAPYIDQHQIVSTMMDLGRGVTEHWSKNLKKKFDAQVLRDAFKHGGFRALYTNRIYYDV